MSRIPEAALLLLSLFTACATLPRADRELFAAVEKDDASEAERLAASGANINVKGDREHDGLTPLAWAGVWGSTRTAELLLARGADVNWANSDGVTALHVAAYNLQPAVATLLINKGATVDARTISGAWTPLYKTIVRLGMPTRPGTSREATVSKALETAGILLTSGADVNARDVKGNTPIHFAVVTGEKTLVQLLIDKGADVNAKNADGVNPLFIAAAGDLVGVAELLIARGADVNAKTATYTPLGRAAAYGSSGVTRVLLDHGADFNVVFSDDATSLNVACRSLLADYTLRNSTPMARAERRRHSADEIATDREQMRYATKQFNIVAVMLMDHGANPNVGTWDLKPLEAAAMVGDKALAEAALAHGAKIDPPPAPGTESPLLAAIGEAHADVVELLINKGADVNARTARLQRNSLHALAAHMPDPRLAELLIRHGADVNAKDLDGQTPLAVAIKEGHDEVADVLRQHGGR